MLGFDIFVHCVPLDVGKGKVSLFVAKDGCFLLLHLDHDVSLPVKYIDVFVIKYFFWRTVRRGNQRRPQHSS